MYTAKEAIKKIKKLWKNHYKHSLSRDAVAIEEMLVILRDTDDEA